MKMILLPKFLFNELQPVAEGEAGGKFVFRKNRPAGFINYGLLGDQADGPARLSGRQVAFVDEAVHGEALRVATGQVLVALVRKGQGPLKRPSFLNRALICAKTSAGRLWGLMFLKVMVLS